MLVALLLAAAAPVPSFSPTLIEAAFAENELHAEQSFAKPTRIVGLLGSVSRDTRGAPYLTLASATGEISCFLESGAAKRAAALARGELVQVVGEHGKRRAIRGVVFSRCRVLWAAGDSEIDPVALNRSLAACIVRWAPDGGVSAEEQAKVTAELLEVHTPLPCSHPLMFSVLHCMDSSDDPECRVEPLRSAAR